MILFNKYTEFEYEVFKNDSKILEDKNIKWVEFAINFNVTKVRVRKANGNRGECMYFIDL